MEQSAPRAATASGGIFLSYRRQDTAYAAGWLFERLAEHYGRDQVFKDVDSLQLGDDFVARIHAAVGSCSALLALIGEEWLTVVDDKGRRRIDDPNDFVRVEVEAGLTRGVLVIPILVDGARMPHPSEVPASLEPLVRRQALELNPARFDFDFSQLRTVLDRMLPTRAAAADRPGATNDAVQVEGQAASRAEVQGSRPAAAGRSSGSRARGSRRAVPVLATLAVATVVALVAFALFRFVGGPSAGGSAEGSDTRSSGTSEVSPTTSTAATKFVIQRRGHDQLKDGVDGIDLPSGQHVRGLGQVQWQLNEIVINGFSTLGATVLGDMDFTAVRPTQLAAAEYGPRYADAAFSQSQLPVGRVLAVHVADGVFAKLAVVRYGPGDTVELRWVTYRAA